MMTADPQTLRTSERLSFPATVTPAEVGKACNVSRRSARSLLIAAGIAERDDSNGRWHVETERLRERLPDVYARVRAWLLRGLNAV